MDTTHRFAFYFRLISMNGLASNWSTRSVWKGNISALFVDVSSGSLDNGPALSSIAICGQRSTKYVCCSCSRTKICAFDWPLASKYEAYTVSTQHHWIQSIWIQFIRPFSERWWAHWATSSLSRHNFWIMCNRRSRRCLRFWRNQPNAIRKWLFWMWCRSWLIKWAIIWCRMRRTCVTICHCCGTRVKTTICCDAQSYRHW